MLEIVVGGGRREAFRLFNRRLALNATANQEEKSLLLVDSESPVFAGHSVWQHLKKQDGWGQPPGSSGDSAYLMVQAMEMWFIADQETLQRFFGPSFDESVFQDLPPLESIPKEKALNKLRQATSRCRPRYRKGKVSSNLLEGIDPETVAASCTHAKDLLDYLRSL